MDMPLGTGLIHSVFMLTIRTSVKPEWIIENILQFLLGTMKIRVKQEIQHILWEYLWEIFEFIEFID